MRIVIWWSVLHGGHRLGLELLFALVRALSLRGGRGGLFSELTKAFTTWLPRRAGARAGHHVDVRALGRGVHAAAGCLIFQLHRLAPRLRASSARWAWSGRFSSIAGFATIRAIIRASTRPNLALLGPTASRRRTAMCHGANCCSRTVWLLWVQYFCLSYGWYFYITWLPTYLQEARQLTFGKSALC